MLVTSLAERPAPLLRCVHLLGRDSGCLSVVVLRKSICTVFEQLLYATLAALDQSPVQRCEALVVRRVHIRTPAQEQIHTRGIALVSCPHQWGVGLRVGDVDGDVLVQEQDELVDIAIECG